MAVRAAQYQRIQGPKPWTQWRMIVWRLAHLVLQSTGRGAFWALAQRMNRARVVEVVASSTGNHGAAVAYAAKQFGIKARIFLPTNCNPLKRGRIASLGAAIVESGDGDLASASALAAEYAKQPGVYFLNDATDAELPAGPATIGCEILEQLPKASAIFVPMGD